MINRLLFNVRKKQKLSIKDASKKIGISSIHLKLIEQGYLHVKAKLQSKFIKIYQLDDNFFTVNSNYVDPINNKKSSSKLEKKIFKNIGKPRVKIISGVISLLMLGLIATGTYFYTRSYVNPRAVWSDNFTSFRAKVIEEKNIEPCLEFPGDAAYYIEAKDNDKYAKVSIPSQDVNAVGTLITLENNDTKIKAFAYNEKKVLMVNGKVDGWLYSTVVTYENLGEYNMSKVSILTEDYLPGSKIYDDVYKSLFSKDGTFITLKNCADSLITAKLDHYGFSLFTNDLESISSYKVFGFRTGLRLLLYPSAVLILSLTAFIFSFIKSHKHKLIKKKHNKELTYRNEYVVDAALVYRSKPNDINFPTIIPEFILRGLSLLILLLSSIGVVWLTRSIFTGTHIDKAFKFNDYISNIFIAGTTLDFFLKLDTYPKKTSKELLKNILMLFVLGAMFYMAECVIYGCLSSSGSIYSILVEILVNFVPGNIVWNLMLYSLIFYFLFTVPKKIEKIPHKVLVWRLFSLIPTLLLIAEFVYQGTFKGELPQYISFLFYTNGVLMTAFAIFYLYSLFFLQQYTKLKYGDEYNKVYVDSRRYTLTKNVLAVLIIVFLVLIDLLFKFYLPDNDVKLGNNWAIALLIPFILFYRPHIGKRTPSWDNTYMVLHTVFLIGGFVISIGMIMYSIDLSQLIEILK